MKIVDKDMYKSAQALAGWVVAFKQLNVGGFTDSELNDMWDLAMLLLRKAYGLDVVK